jgi:hypothetical protein
MMSESKDAQHTPYSTVIATLRRRIKKTQLWADGSRAKGETNVSKNTLAACHQHA